MTKRQRATLDDAIRKLAWSVGQRDWSVDITPAESLELLRALGVVKGKSNERKRKS